MSVERFVGDAWTVAAEPREEAKVVDLDSPQPADGPVQVCDGQDGANVHVEAEAETCPQTEVAEEPDHVLRQARSDALRAELEAVTAKARADIARARADEAEALARLRMVDRQQARDNLDGDHLESLHGSSLAGTDGLLTTVNATKAELHPPLQTPAPPSTDAEAPSVEAAHGSSLAGTDVLLTTVNAPKPEPQPPLQTPAPPSTDAEAPSVEAAHGSSLAGTDVLLTTVNAPKPGPQPPAQPSAPPSTDAEPPSVNQASPSTAADARLTSSDGRTLALSTEEGEPDARRWGRHRPARVHRSADSRRASLSRGPRAVRAVLVVAMIAAAAFATTAGLGWAGRPGNNAGISAVRTDVVLDATQDITILNTLDYRSIDTGLASWLGATTGALHDGLSTTSAADRSALAAAKDVTTATVLDLAVLQLDRHGGTATVMASVQIVVRPTTGAATTKRERLQGSMTRADGVWKLSTLAPVGLSF